MKGLATTQNRDINSIRAYKLSYVNSMDLIPPFPSPANDPGLTNQMGKMDVMMEEMIKCIHSIGRHSNRNNDNDSGDHDDDSQSSLDKKHMSDFYQGAHK